MAKSLLDRLGAEDYALIKERVYYDPLSPTGLRWRQVARPISGRQAPKDGVAGSNNTLFVESNTYPCAAVVLLLNDIWPEDGQNVATRKDPSGPWGDVTNLEWAKHGESRKRNAEPTRVALVRSVLGHEGPDLGDRLRLNAPCKKGHLWNGHQLGLQRKWGQSWRCDECQKDRHSTPEKKAYQREWYAQNLEEQRRKARDRMAAKLQNPEYRKIANERSRLSNAKARAIKGRVSRSGLHIPPHLYDHGLRSSNLQVFIELGFSLESLSLETIQQQQAMWQHIKAIKPATSVAKLAMDEQQRYWKENPEAKKEHDRQWGQAKWWLEYQTRPERRLYIRQKSKRRKALLREQTAHQIRPRELRARFVLFGNCCAYCGASGDMEIEHVIAISKGGTHAMGNIVPACHDCNSSKRAKEPETWYRQQPFFTECRWRKICRVLGWQRSSVGQLALL